MRKESRRSEQDSIDSCLLRHHDVDIDARYIQYTHSYYSAKRHPSPSAPALLCTIVVLRSSWAVQRATVTCLQMTNDPKLFPKFI